MIEIPPAPEAPPAVEGEEPKQVSEEEKQAYELIVNEIKLKNASIEASNEEIRKIKEKVKINPRTHNF